MSGEMNPTDLDRWITGGGDPDGAGDKWDTRPRSASIELPCDVDYHMGEDGEVIVDALYLGKTKVVSPDVLGWLSGELEESLRDLADAKEIRRG